MGRHCCFGPDPRFDAGVQTAVIGAYRPVLLE
jgi:hypothetical protein